MTATETTLPEGYTRVDLLTREELIDLVCLIDYARRNPRHVEALKQMHDTGPVWDGYLVSKQYRDALRNIGACAKVIVSGRQGFNACTVRGATLLKIYDWLTTEPQP